MKSPGVTIQMKPLHHFTKSVKIGNFGVLNWAISGAKSKFERCYTDNNRNQHQRLINKGSFNQTKSYKYCTISNFNCLAISEMVRKLTRHLYLGQSI